MRLLFVLALALLPVGLVSGWAGVGMLRERRVPRRRGAGAADAVVCALCLAVGVVATSAAVATVGLAVAAFS